MLHLVGPITLICHDCHVYSCLRYKIMWFDRQKARFLQHVGFCSPNYIGLHARSTLLQARKLQV
jgi:hypothetical protein